MLTQQPRGPMLGQRQIPSFSDLHLWNGSLAHALKLRGDVLDLNIMCYPRSLLILSSPKMTTIERVRAARERKDHGDQPSSIS